MEVPLWLIVFGSIGGLLSSGVIGLFTGPVVLVLGYELLRDWQRGGEVVNADGGDPQPGQG